MLRNQAIQQVVHDIDTWRARQTETLISDLVLSVTSQNPDLSTLAHQVGLDPRVQEWVDKIRPRPRHAAIQMINQETVEDCLVPHAQEILESEWLKQETEIHRELETKAANLTEELTANIEVMMETRKQSLQQAAEDYLRKFQEETDASTADEIQRIKNKAKSLTQHAKDNEEARTLQSVVRTPKATKPSPLNITKPKRKKKKVTILDLTTPPPEMNLSTATRTWRPRKTRPPPRPSAN